MRITIEADFEGEQVETKVFENVTQCVLGGMLTRQGLVPGTFTFLQVGNPYELIGVTAMLTEYLRDFKTKRKTKKKKPK